MQHQRDDVIDLASDDDSQSSRQNRERSSSPDLLLSSPENSPPRARIRRSDNTLNDSRLRPVAARRLNDAPQEVVSLLNSPQGNNNNRSNRNQEWACTRCTLLNSPSRRTCCACGAMRQHSESIHLDDDDDDEQEVVFERTTNSRNAQQNVNTSTSQFVGGGAFLGGMLGAADAYANGTGVARGAVRGAVSGAVGGVLMGEVFRQPPAPSAQPFVGSASFERTVGTAPAAGTASSGHDTFANDGWGRRTNQTTDAYLFQAYPNRTYIRNNPTIFDQFLQSMQHQQQMQQPNIDNMSYERLLEVFGDGNENRNLAAPPQVISSLPSSRITNLEELPEDKRQCVICMEDYAQGEERTMLPCWHGFHKECVNRWLRSKGCCPVCKTEVG